MSIITQRKKNVKKLPGIFNGIVFWKKPKVEVLPASRVEELMVAVIKYLPQIKELLRSQTSQVSINATGGELSDGSQLGKMYDFFKNYGQTTTDGADFIINSGINGLNMPAEIPTIREAGNKPEAEEPPMTPKMAMAELETFPTPELTAGLDQKIATLKDKSLMVNQSFAKQQIDQLIKRLENRRKYFDHEEFYRHFPNTNDHAIDKLLKKYKLVIKPADLFIPTFPTQAIEIMKEYTRITKLVCDETPVYYVIAEQVDFNKKLEKLDPILLVQSPFGYWWQVLGAYDKEMLLLSEL